MHRFGLPQSVSSRSVAQGLDRRAFFAKTLSTLEVDLFEDAKGEKHDWRKELTAALAKRQKDNGSWVNSADRWMEGDRKSVV